MSLFRRRDPIAVFWQWFVDHREELHDLSPDNPSLITEVGDRLRTIDQGLVFECTMNEGRAVEFVVSADGNVELFPIVMKTVNAAPPIDGWSIQGFRQPGKPDVSIEMGGVTLRAEDLSFLAERDGARVGLTIFVPELTPENHDHLARMTFILLDNSLGEFLVETGVGFIQLAPGETAPEEAQPFVEVLSFVAEAVQ
jgi:hypothetical protein